MSEEAGEKPVEKPKARSIPDITYQDVVICIDVLTKYIQASKRVEAILRKIAPRTAYSRPEDRILEMIMRQQYGAIPSEEPEVEMELTDEERKRLEELKKKYMGL